LLKENLIKLLSGNQMQDIRSGAKLNISNA